MNSNPIGDIGSLLNGLAGAPLDAPRQLDVLVGSNRHAITIARQPTPSELRVVAELLHANEVNGLLVSSLDEARALEILAALRPAFSVAPPHVSEFSIGPMTRPGDFVGIRAATSVLADALNDAAARLVAAGVDDAQFVLSRLAPGSRFRVEAVTGVALDVDRDVIDAATVHLERGALAPNVAYRTPSGGARLLYVVDSPVALEKQATDAMRTLDDLRDQLVLGVAGVDPRCLRPEQRQHLPSAWRTLGGARRLVEHLATAVAAAPIDLARLQPAVPAPVADALGLVVTRVLKHERVEVEQYLATIGASVPAAGSSLGYRCPIKRHNHRKAYVNRHTDGSLSIYCLGGHGGEGPIRWTERELLALAHGGEQ